MTFRKMISYIAVITLLASSVAFYNVNVSGNPVNLALSATVSAVETVGGFPPSNAIDGKESTAWATNENANAPSFTIQWSTPQTMNYIIMRMRTPDRDNGGFSGSRMEFFDQSDSIIKTITFTSNMFIGNNLVKHIVFAEMTGIYKIRFSANNSIGWPGLKEFEVYSDPSPNPNLALRAELSASSFYNVDFGPDMAADANDGSEWASSGGVNAQEWFMFRWDVPQNISQITLKARTWAGNQLKDVKIELFDPNDTLIKTIPVDASFLGNSVEQIPFDTVAGVSKVKISATNVGMTSGFREIEIYYSAKDEVLLDGVKEHFYSAAPDLIIGDTPDEYKNGMTELTAKHAKMNVYTYLDDYYLYLFVDIQQDNIGANDRAQIWIDPTPSSVIAETIYGGCITNGDEFVVEIEPDGLTRVLHLVTQSKVKAIAYGCSYNGTGYGAEIRIERQSGEPGIGISPQIYIGGVVSLELNTSFAPGIRYTNAHVFRFAAQTGVEIDGIKDAQFYPQTTEAVMGDTPDEYKNGMTAITAKHAKMDIPIF